MVSTRRPNQAERVASNARLRVHGGCICADARNAATSVAVILHPISMHRSITPRRVTRSSRASSPASIGFMTIVRKNSSTVRSFTPLSRIRRINRYPDQPERCLRTGKRCFTNRDGSLVWPQRARSNLRGVPMQKDRHSPFGCMLASCDFEAIRLLLSLLARGSELRCNIHEVGERAGAHLSHHLASVRLHGNLADAELEADLFIQPTADHQRHDLPLAAA
jgi:hypothetical protein